MAIGKTIEPRSNVRRTKSIEDINPLSRKNSVKGLIQSVETDPLDAEGDTLVFTVTGD